MSIVTYENEVFCGNPLTITQNSGTVPIATKYLYAAGRNDVVERYNLDDLTYVDTTSSLNDTVKYLCIID